MDLYYFISHLYMYNMSVINLCIVITFCLMIVSYNWLCLLHVDYVTCHDIVQSVLMKDLVYHCIVWRHNIQVHSGAKCKINVRESFSSFTKIWYYNNGGVRRHRMEKIHENMFGVFM